MPSCPTMYSSVPPWVSAIMAFSAPLGSPSPRHWDSPIAICAMGYPPHADDESQFDQLFSLSRSVIGSVFGEARHAIRFSPLGKSSQMVDVVVPGGWVYVMYGNFQARFYHSIVQSIPRSLLSRIRPVIMELPDWNWLTATQEVKEDSATGLAFCNWVSDCFYTRWSIP